MALNRVAFQIAENPPARLDKALARDVPEEAALSRTRLAKLLEAGLVTLDGAVVSDPKAKVAEGADVVIEVPVADESHIGPEDLPLDVVFEDDDLIVINKPAGMVVHPAPGTPNGTLVNALLHHCGDSLSGVGGSKRPGIVHRIDKDTTGVLVVAKTEPAHKGLSELFATHTIDRTYLALTRGAPRPGAGTVESDIARSPRDRKKMAVVPDGEGRHAVTHYKTLETYGEISKVEARPAAALIECRLETGRTHQIRVHMAHIGYPLVGDSVYAGRLKVPRGASGTLIETLRSFPRQALHAGELGLIHPQHEDYMHWQAPLPDDMNQLLAVLSQENAP